MSQNHTAKIPITLNVGGDEIEFIAELDFTIKPGSPATFDDPADPAEIEYGREIDLVIIDKTEQPPKEIREKCPDWLANFLNNSDAVYQQCGDQAGWGEDDGPDPDEAYERKRDERITS